MRIWDGAAHAWAIAGAACFAALSGIFWVAEQRAVALASVGTAPLWYALCMRRSFRRMRLAKVPVPPEWLAILEKRVPAYRRLPPERKTDFARDVAIFVRENLFRGVDGVEATDELKVLAAASAVMLLFGRTEREYPKIAEILFYPKPQDDVAGLLHPHGAIVLSAPELLRSFACETDGYHVGLHEFAHALDLTGQACDGLPLDLDPRLLRPWCELMCVEIERIRRGRGALRSYGGTNEAEFWAVSVETYFERPEALRKANPDLFAILQEYFRASG